MPKAKPIASDSKKPGTPVLPNGAVRRNGEALANGQDADCGHAASSPVRFSPLPVSAQRADEETHHGASLHDCDAPAYDESSYQKLREVFPDQSEPISIRLMFERELRDGATPEAMIDAARTYNQLVDGEPPGIILAEFLRDRYWRDCRAISKFDALEKEAA